MSDAKLLGSDGVPKDYSSQTSVRACPTCGAEQVMQRTDAHRPQRGEKKSQGAGPKLELSAAFCREERRRKCAASRMDAARWHGWAQQHRRVRAQDHEL
ncbi:hypothetical protein FQA47_003830 [Oryzias melastigma]|uniref:Uncharacterized protein n=1 Tax=Oryzias melastigma TaxID=30732 RepID=A0A834CJ85_ORYME|nr:hypothetical protein FQA47_003830 [Oryzias melastigma]